MLLSSAETEPIMQILASESFLKIAASFDDQPGFVNRDQGVGGLSGTSPNRGTEGDEAIIDRWDGKKKKRKKPKMKQVYQLGLTVPESPREEAERLDTMTQANPSSVHSEITLRVTDTVTYVEGTLDRDIYQSLKKALGYQDDKAMWKAPRGKDGKPNSKWDGWKTTVCYNRKYCRCFVKKEGTHFPTGLLSRAREFFDLENVPYKQVDSRVKVESDSRFSMSPDFEPRDYQLDIIKKAVKRQRGIVKMATGGGKTATASGIIAELGVTPFIFYVTSIDLLKQAKAELERFIRYDGKPIEVGMIGGGKCDIKDINIMTVQTAVRALGLKFTKFDDESSGDNGKYDATDKEKIADLIHNCEGMICDEVQHWAAKTCQVIADHSHKAKYRYGLSATPWRDEGDDILIDACFGKPIVDINATFLIDQGILVRPTIYFVHMPRLDIDGSYQTVYKEGIVENIERNTMIANVADQMTKNGRQTLILCKHIEHGNTLESMIPGSFFINGTHTGKQREEWIQKMRDQEAPVTIATSIFDEGVDVKPLNGLILAGSGKSQTRALQRVGRVIRSYTDPVTGIAKSDAFVVDFLDNTRYLRSHSDRRRGIYQTEPGFVIKDYK
jgi:superfamily II DNA or RNA helicase